MKTILILAGEVLGSTDTVLSMGDVIKVSPRLKPMVVRQVLEIPKEAELNAEGEEIATMNWRGIEGDYIAYLHFDGEIAAKFSKQKKTSRKYESSLAKSLHGKTTPGSGAFAFHKGDVISDFWLAEHKYTDNSEYRLTDRIWSKITEEAFGRNRNPLMEIVLNNNTIPFKIIVINLLSFADATNCTEEEMVTAFHFQMIESNDKSVKLNVAEIRKFCDNVRADMEYKMPAFLLKFNGHNLLAMETFNFVRILDEE